LHFEVLQPYVEVCWFVATLTEVDSHHMHLHTYRHGPQSVHVLLSVNVPPLIVYLQ
jgi:hypothetical protein